MSQNATEKQEQRNCVRGCILEKIEIGNLIQTEVDNREEVIPRAKPNWKCKVRVARSFGGREIEARLINAITWLIYNMFERMIDSQLVLRRFLICSNYWKTQLPSYRNNPFNFYYTNFEYTNRLLRMALDK